MIAQFDELIDIGSGEMLRVPHPGTEQILRHTSLEAHAVSVLDELDLAGKPFKGYLRGKLQLEVWALAESLRLGDAQRFAAWQPRLRDELLAGQAKDGSFAGWYGPAYGTALVLLLLVLGTLLTIVGMESRAGRGR